MVVLQSQSEGAVAGVEVNRITSEQAQPDIAVVGSWLLITGLLNDLLLAVTLAT